MGALCLISRSIYLENGKYSFLSPRVIIDSGDMKQYWLIFHDNGILELAEDQRNVWTSGVEVSDVGYNLKSPNNSINVTVGRFFDKVQVWINGNLEMSFLTDPNVSKVSISSQQSISQFTNIQMQTRNILRLFATSQPAAKVDFSVQQKGPDKSVLTISNPASDYAVVDQYLNTPLRNIESQTNNTAVVANIFFNGWIIHSDTIHETKTSITIGIKNSQTNLALTGLAILLTYSILIIGCIPTVKNHLQVFVTKLLSKKPNEIEKEKVQYR